MLGAGGQLGRALLDRPWPAGLAARGLGRGELDVTDAAGLDATMKALSPRVVINAAAFTGVREAERRVGDAFAANALGPARLAEACARRGVALVHLSTDYVFDGALGRPYLEPDSTNPLQAYGASKRAGELAVLASDADALVLRTAWVHGGPERNFAAAILGAAADGRALRVVDDQVGSPTGVQALATALVGVAERVLDRDPQRGRLFHIAGGGEASWADLAEALLAESGRRGGPTAPVERVGTRAYGDPVPRPADSRLDSGALAAQLGVRLPHWRESLAETVDAMLSVWSRT